MDYITEIRKLVGHRPLIMAGSTVLILDRGNRLLMMRRTDNHCWGVPGGAMELGETYEETARRETLEEVGVELREIELFSVQSGPESHYIYANGDEIYAANITYLVREFSGEIILDTEEHSEYRYFNLDDLPDDISPPIKPILRDLVMRLKKLPPV